MWRHDELSTSSMGIIMAVVAVLEIHMERNMEHAMKPSMIRAGLVPTRLSIASAILEAKYCSSMLV